MKQGKLYLIPTYLSESNTPKNITMAVKEVILSTKHYLVENMRTARRFISSLQLGIDIASLHFSQMDKHVDSEQLSSLFLPLLKGENMGIISEAGLPAIADPGALAVHYAHQKDIEVVCLEGGSSIILSLISSGLNGQNFTFHGYLPIDKAQRVIKIKEMEKACRMSGYTQLFMETPYRNQQLLKVLFEVLSKEIILYIGADLTGTTPFSKTKKIALWKNETILINKQPAMFAIGF